MTATSWSGRSQPTGRPDIAASTPLTRLVQSAPVSSSHNPAASFFTISPTGGGLGLPAARGGSKLPPSFGGGLTPPWGPAGSLTTFGGNPPAIVPPPPRIVEPLPDSKMAT